MSDVHQTVGHLAELEVPIQLRDSAVKKSNPKAKRIAMEECITAIFEDVGKRLGVDWDE